jgi:hypothetical protein
MERTVKSSFFIFSIFILSACVTSSRPHDPAQPQLSWDAACEPENLSGMTSWLVLTCTMTNRSDQPLTFHAIDRIASENDAWTQPNAEELDLLKRDLKTYQSRKNLPLMLNGGDRLEGFVAQVFVVSGLWLTQSLKDPVELPKIIEKSVNVKPGEHVRQAFVLYKESLKAPTFVTLISTDGKFQKQVALTATARQRGAG